MLPGHSGQPPSNVHPIHGPGNSGGDGGTIDPGILVSPNNPPGSVTRGTKRAVIASVDDANSPKWATVLIENHIPGESGYSIPAGWGPFAAGGTSGFNYFYNNTSGVGGSWVLVDADRKMILALDQGISTTAATPYYKAIADHLHSGNLNPDGFTNPQPVDLSAGQSQNALPYNQNSNPVKSVINSSGQTLLNEFPGSVLNSDGSLTNVDGVSSTLQYQMSASKIFTVGADISSGTTSGTTGLYLGNLTNGYGIEWASGSISLVKYVSGVRTLIGTSTAVTADTNYHSYRLTITPGVSNSIEASVDGNTFAVQDNGLLINGPFGVTLKTGNNAGKVLHYSASSTPIHYGGLPPRILPIIIPPWVTLPSDGSPLSTGIIANRHFGGSANVDGLPDGTTYGRPLLTRLNGGKPWIDFSESIHLNKVLDNIADGSVYGRPLLARLSAGKPWIDFSEAIHANKNLDNISDGSTYGSIPLVNISGTGTAKRALIDFSQGHANKNLDNVNDGTAYARPKASELSSGIVTRIGDGGGTNYRTYAHIAGAIDTSSRVVGNIYDGTTALTPGNVTSVITTSGTVDVSKPKAGVTLPRSAHDASLTSAIDSSSRLVTSVYDGTTSLTPANLTNAITNAGLVKVANATGTLPRANHDSSLTNAIDASSRLVGSVYDGTTALTPGNLTAVITTAGTVDVSKPKAGVTLPRSAHDASITNAIDTSSRLITSIYDGTTSLTPANLTNVITNAGLVKVANATGTLPRANTHSSITNAIDASSNIASTPFSGGLLKPDGSLTNVHSVSSAYTYNLVANQPISFSADIAMGSGGTSIGLILGNTTYGYGITWDNANHIYIAKWVNGAFSIISNLVSATLDNNFHTLRLTVTAATSGGNLIEASIDGYVPNTVYDSSVSLISGPINVMLNTGNSSGVVRNFQTYVTTNHYGTAPQALTTNFDFSGILKGSGTMNTNVPNSTAWTTDFKLHWSSIGTGTFTMRFWYDNGTSSTNSTIWRPNGTTINLGYSTQSSPSASLTGVASGAPIYMLAYYQGGIMTVTASLTSFSQSTVNQAYADGGYVAFNATTQASSQITGGGSGSAAGGGSTQQHNNF